MEDLLTARCLVDSSDASHTIPVRVANLKDNRITLRQGKVFGTCEPIVRVARCSEDVQKTVSRHPTTEELSTFKKTWTHLDQHRMAKAVEFIYSEADVFAWEKIEGRTSLVQLRINTGLEQPIRQRPRRLSFMRQKAIDYMIKRTTVTGSFKNLADHDHLQSYL